VRRSEGRCIRPWSVIDGSVDLSEARLRLENGIYLRRAESWIANGIHVDG